MRPHSVFAQGKIAEEGTHAELLQKRGLYFGLYTAQEKEAEMENNRETSALAGVMKTIFRMIRMGMPK